MMIWIMCAFMFRVNWSITWLLPTWLLSSYITSHKFKFQMRTCLVPGCKGKFSFNGSKVHKLPDIEPVRSAWLEAVPILKSSSVKCPSVCCLHFLPSDYGKNKKYLKPTAVPSRHLYLDPLDSGSNTSLLNDVIKNILDIPAVLNCDKENCHELFLSAKSLHTYNKRLMNRIKTLENKVAQLEDQVANSSVKEQLKNSLSESDFMLGPTQLKCIVNKVKTHKTSPSFQRISWISSFKSRAR